jgi:hypothetical protein
MKVSGRKSRSNKFDNSMVFCFKNKQLYLFIATLSHPSEKNDSFICMNLSKLRTRFAESESIYSGTSFTWSCDCKKTKLKVIENLRVESVNILKLLCA